MMSSISLDTEYRPRLWKRCVRAEKIFFHFHSTDPKTITGFDWQSFNCHWQVMLEHTSVVDAAVVGFEDKIKGVVPLGFLVLERGSFCCQMFF